LKKIRDGAQKEMRTISNYINYLLAQAFKTVSKEK
jgi:hypothetical protein